MLALRGVVALAECKKAGLSAVCNFNGVDVRWSAPRPHPPLPKRERERESARVCEREKETERKRGGVGDVCVPRAGVCVCSSAGQLFGAVCEPAATVRFGGRLECTPPHPPARAARKC